MGALDELRKQVDDFIEEVEGAGPVSRELMGALFDAFEAAHPGLVDMSVCGSHCPAFDGISDSDETYCHIYSHTPPVVGAPCHRLTCPACAKDAT